MDVNIFKDEAYDFEPIVVMRHYIDQQCDYQCRMHPTADPAVIRNIVTDIAKERFKDPTVKRVNFPEPGHYQKEIVNTTKHMGDIDGLITSPSGNSYCQPKDRESLVRITINDNIAQRDEYKKNMFIAEQSGDDHARSIYYNLQTTKKISNNATPGGMQSVYNIFTDKSGFNAITSTTRLGVKTAYGHVERLFAGNIFLPSLEDAISYIFSTISVIPSNTAEVLKKYSNCIKLIDKETFLNWLVECMEWYNYQANFRDKLEQVVNTLSDIERTYVFYAGSLYNLFKINKEYFRDFFNGAFRRDIPVSPDIKAEDIYKLESTLSIVVRGTNPELFGRDEKGELNNLTNAVKNNPEGIRQIVAYARYMEDYLNERGDLLSLFLKTRHETPQPLFNQRMIRKATILCDTDSNLFTTNNIVELYHGLERGQTNYSSASFDVNALSVYILSRMLEHTFARYSSRSGVLKADQNRILMKNEFLFPAFLRTGIGKHYGGICTYQEGNRLRNPNMDIKGVNLVGSTMPKEITKGVSDFLKEIFLAVIKSNGAISVEALANRIAEIEKSILKALNEGDKTFLRGVNIKSPDSYADKGEKSCFYYNLWEEVFADHYGIHSVLPNRFVKVSIRGGDKLWSDKEVMAGFEKKYPEVYARFLQFRKDYPSKKINYLIFPVSLSHIPDMFTDWIDKRDIIYSLCIPYYILMSSFNVNFAVKDKDVLVMDFLSGEHLPLT